MKNSNLLNSALIGIAAIIGGVSLVTVTLIAIPSPDNLAIAPWIVGILSVLGVALGYFAPKSIPGLESAPAENPPPADPES